MKVSLKNHHAKTWFVTGTSATVTFVLAHHLANDAQNVLAPDRCRRHLRDRWIYHACLPFSLSHRSLIEFVKCNYKEGSLVNTGDFLFVVTENFVVQFSRSCRNARLEG